MPTFDLDWTGTTEDGFTIAPEGTYLAEVDSVEPKRTAGGEMSLSVQLRDPNSRAQICIDTLMLTGKGRGIGLAKLRQLGVPEGQQKLDPLSLVGRRVRVAIYHEKYEGQPRAKVNIKAEGFKCGYLAVAENGGVVKVDDPF